MRAWVCTALNGEDGLRLEDVPSPVCTANQIKIRNHCASLNFPDVLITRGKYQLRLEPPFVPGGECAGVIAQIGTDVRDFAVGQRVMALSGYGAFAEEVVVAPPAQQVHAIPAGMSFADAAAFNMVYGTSYHGLNQRGQLRPGETLLVLGASGGCGSAAVELGRAMGATVIAGASTDDKCALAICRGAHSGVNYGKEPLRDRVMELTNDRGVDVIFDPVGGSLFDEAKRCVAWNGRYLVIGFASGTIPSLAINYTILKSMSVIGVAYGMSAIRDMAINAANFGQLFRWYEEGKLKPHIGRLCHLAQLPEACREMFAGNAIGKTVVDFV